MDASIVLVDNEPKFLVAYERLLRGLGCTAFCAQRLSDAIPYVLSPHVALVVVEPRLVDGDGLELIRMARRTRPPGSGIVITAFPSQMGARQAGEAGAAGTLRSRSLVVCSWGSPRDCLGRGAPPVADGWLVRFPLREKPSRRDGARWRSPEGDSRLQGVGTGGTG